MPRSKNLACCVGRRKHYDTTSVSFLPFLGLSVDVNLGDRSCDRDEILGDKSCNTNHADES